MRGNRTLRVGAVLAALVFGLVLVCLLRPPCLILQHTGFYCVGCGTSRMVISLLHGDVAGAFSHNPFMFAVLPPGAVYVLLEGWRYARAETPLYRKKSVQAAFLAISALALVFMVLRNLPGITALGP